MDGYEQARRRLRANDQRVVKKEVVAMRGKLMFLGGLAAGFVIGARAGREKYEELVRTARKIKESPTVQEAAGVVQEQATRLYSEGKDKVTDKLSNSRFAETNIGQRLLSAADTEAGAKAIDKTDTLATTSPVNSTKSSGTSSGV
jgi:hypothetical protein